MVTSAKNNANCDNIVNKPTSIVRLSDLSSFPDISEHTDQFSFLSFSPFLRSLALRTFSDNTFVTTMQLSIDGKTYPVFSQYRTSESEATNYFIKYESSQYKVEIVTNWHSPDPVHPFLDYSTIEINKVECLGEVSDPDGINNIEHHIVG